MAPRQSKTQLSTFPRNVSFAKDGTTVHYQQQLTRACVQANDVTGPLAESLTVVADIDTDRIIVETTAQRVKDLIAQSKAVPAYNYEGGPSSFVPTGRIFVRVGRDASVDEFVEEIGAAGFDIAQPHPKFDFAAWLTSSSGQMSEALRQCEALEQIKGVEIAEPEMLSASVRR